MDTNDFFYGITKYLERNYGATCSGMWFWNTNKKPLLFVQIKGNRRIIVMYTEELLNVYEKDGWTKLCDILDNVIREFHERYG